jgi:hypothetical protein
VIIGHGNTYKDKYPIESISITRGRRGGDVGDFTGATLEAA